MVVAWQMAQKEILEALKPAAQQPGSSGSAAAKLKPPTALEPGIWSQQINKHNSVMIGVVPGMFPEKTILGSEVALERTWREFHTTKMFTPVTAPYSHLRAHETYPFIA